MALKVADRVKETTNTQGTGTYTLLGAATGFESFSVIGNGNTTYYCCTDGTNFEIGIGTYTASGTTLARTTILQSSNSDTAVNWAAGTREIFVTQPAEKAVFTDANGNIVTTNDGTPQLSAPILSGSSSAAGSILFKEDTDNGTNAVTLIGPASTADVTVTLPSSAGTVALTSDIPSAGISSGNVATFTSGAVDNDFLRIDGTAIEGRSASEVLSDIGGQASLTFGISNTNAVKIDSGDVADDEYARFTANGLESRSTSEVLSDIGAQASLTFGISNTNAVKIDSASVADDEYARFTANGLESRATSEVLSDIGAITASSSDTLTNKTIDASQLSGTVANARLDQQLQDVAGLAVTDGNFIVGDGSNFVAESGATARTSLGLGTAAVLDTGISNTNIPKFTSGVADDDFLRVNGTDIEGRSASEVLSDIAAMPLAGGTFTGDVTLTDTDTGDAAGPLLTIRRDSSSPADNDLLGRIEFKGENDAGQSFDYATITAKLLDNTDGTEDGGLILSVGQAGSSVQGRISLQGYGDTVFSNKNIRLSTGVNLKFEGATDDAHETTLTVTDPTGDRTITLPDATGTVQLTDGSGASLTSLNASELGSGTVPNARLDAQLQDVAGLAVTDGNFIVGDGSNFVAESGATVRTSLGLGTAAVLDTGISNTNVPKFTSGVADDDFLRVNGTDIEGRSAAEVLSDIAAMPLAGGTFSDDVTFTGASYNVVWDKSDDALEFADNAKAVFGAGDDLQIYHNGSNSIIHDAGTGVLLMRTNTLKVNNGGNSEKLLHAFDGGAVELYHNNIKKLETTADGVTIMSTDDGASEAPALSLYRNSASPASSDDTGAIIFNGENDADEKIEYARLDSRIGAVADGAEYGRFGIDVMTNGSSTSYYLASYSLNQFYQDIYLGTNVDITFEGTAYNDHETKLTATNPTADRTITLPDATGTVALTNGNAVLLNTTTVSSAVSSVDFGSSLVTDTYNDYLLVISGLTVSANTRFRMRLGTSNAQDTSSIYSGSMVWQGRSYNPSDTSIDNATRTINTNSVGFWNISGDGSYEPSNSSVAHNTMIIRLNDLRSTSLHKHAFVEQGLIVVEDISGGTDNGFDYFQGIRHSALIYKNTAAVNFIRFYEVDFSTQIDGGTFSLYGLLE